MSYVELLPQLIELKRVELSSWKTDPGKLSANFNPNARCDFHSSGQGHTIENCYAFKHKVQDLLDSRPLTLSQRPILRINLCLLMAAPLSMQSLKMKI